MKGLRTSAAALACALVMGPAAAATADTWTHTDATGDVRTVTDDSTGEHVSPADPTLTVPDVIRTRVAHNRGAIVVKTTLAAGLPAANWAWAMDFKTPTGKYFLARVKDRKASTLFFDPHFRRVKCPNLKFALDSPRTRITMTVPRSCLNAPAWVRVGSTLATFSSPLLAPDGGADEIDKVDDANSASLGKNPVLSPKVFAPKG